jgi:hypothetical protein
MNKYYYFWQMMNQEIETQTEEIATRFLRGEDITETPELVS